MSAVAIVGAGPAGFSAARAYRAAGGERPVVLLGIEAHRPYNRPPLTKDYLRGETARAELDLEDAGWFAEHDVELLLGTPATRLDADRGRLLLNDGRELAFAACVLATGSDPMRLPLPGAEDPDLLLVRRVEDSERLRERVGEGTRVIVVGSGFIGCEAAASLALRGAHVTQLTMEAAPQDQRLGEQAGARIAGWLEALGVELRTGVEIERIERTQQGHRVHLAGGEAAEAEVVALGAGVRPNAGVAAAAGLATRDGRVLTDPAMRTSAPAVHAAGDVALAHNPRAGRRLVVEHWGEALNHGEVAGRVLAGQDAVWDVAPGFWSTIGEHTLKYVAWGDGFDEARLDDHGDGAFTVYYGQAGTTVGVLAHERDEDYERGRELVESGAPLP